jgi:hypothetical protein
MVIPEVAPSSAGLRRTAAGWTGFAPALRAFGRTDVAARGAAALLREAAGFAAGAVRRAVARAAVAVRRPLLEEPFFGRLRTVVDPFFALEAFFDD